MLYSRQTLSALSETIMRLEYGGNLLSSLLVELHTYLPIVIRDQVNMSLNNFFVQVGGAINYISTRF